MTTDPGGAMTGSNTHKITLQLPDGYRTNVVCHLPQGQVSKLPVVYLHGIQSHPGWFEGSGDYLGAAGHEVFQVTRRGSGENRQDRSHAKSPDQLLADITAAVNFVKKTTHSKRVHLLGVSWGGKLAARYAFSPEAADLASLVLIAPGIAAKVDVSIATKIKIGLSLLLYPKARFPIPLNEVALFTDNPIWREYVSVDPLRLNRATASLLYTSRKIDRQIDAAPTGGITLVTSLILANRDRIIDNKATIEKVKRLTGGRAKVIALEASHTLEFEVNPQPFYEALVKCLAEAEASQGSSD